MLDEINRLSLFFEDCYREISVREYARLLNVSPPNASKILKTYEKKQILIQRSERGFLFFRINIDNTAVKNLSRVYWEWKISGLLDFIIKKSFPKSIVLFGSLSKLEATTDSDIDLAIISSIKKDLDFSYFEKSLKRKIHVVFYESFDKINNELKFNILNGYILRGYLS